MYTTERFESTIDVNTYIKDYVDVETFLKCCKECPNYGKVWSCPPYDFDVIDYWKKYKIFDVVAVKIIFDEDYAGKTFPQEEMYRIANDSLWKVKAQLAEELSAREKEIPGSVSLSAGACTACNGNCTRPEGTPCRFPENMRYSIESLGGNVGLTISKLLGIELEWIEEGVLPNYFVLVSGLLR